MGVSASSASQHWVRQRKAPADSFFCTLFHTRLEDGRQQAVEGIVKLKNNLHERRLLFVQLLQHLLYGTLQLGILATQLRLGRVVDLDVGL